MFQCRFCVAPADSVRRFPTGSAHCGHRCSSAGSQHLCQPGHRIREIAQDGLGEQISAAHPLSPSTVCSFENLSVNLTNELARQRNRDAAERTLMAWIRTCLSLISFGFGLDKIVGAIDRATGSSGPRAGVIAVALAFVFTGILSMAVATVEHLRELRRLRRDDFVYVETPRLAAATATLITLIGVMAMAILITGLVR
jgi:putative membrane protein